MMELYFALIDSNNVVENVVVCLDRPEGWDDFFATITPPGYHWRQCSVIVGIGHRWHESTGRFVEPMAYPSWTYDDVVGEWISPIPKPDGDNWFWNEYEQQWHQLPDS